MDAAPVEYHCTVEDISKLIEDELIFLDEVFQTSYSSLFYQGQAQSLIKLRAYINPQNTPEEVKQVIRHIEGALNNPSQFGQSTLSSSSTLLESL